MIYTVQTHSYNEGVVGDLFNRILEVLKEIFKVIKDFFNTIIGRKDKSSIKDFKDMFKVPELKFNSSIGYEKASKSGTKLFIYTYSDEVINQLKQFNKKYKKIIENEDIFMIDKFTNNVKSFLFDKNINKLKELNESILNDMKDNKEKIDQIKNSEKTEREMQWPILIKLMKI